MSALEFGSKNGHLDLLDWDLAVVNHIGAQLDQSKNQYFLPLNGIYTNENGDPIEKALVVYKRPEPTQVEMDLPMIALTRDDITPDEGRLYTIAQQYRLPAQGTQRISARGSLGFTDYEQKEQERPYDLIYTIECWSRYRTVAQMLLLIMMTKFPLKGSITVVDGLQCERVYAAYQEGTSDLTELSSLVDRVPGYSMTVRLEGELTLDRMPQEFPAFIGETSDTPFDPDDPDPGPGGKFADGQPNITIDNIGC